MPLAPPPSRASTAVFNRFRHKKLITQSVFAPLPNTQKAKRCLEQGRPFDVGYATDQVDPLVDLAHLHQDKKKKKPKVPAADGQQEEPAHMDTKPLLMLPSSQTALRTAESAWIALTLHRAEIAAGDFDKLEQNLGKRWLGRLLSEGQIYRLGDSCDALCLGCFGYAAMFWTVRRVEAHALGFDVFSMRAAWLESLIRIRHSIHQ